MATSRAMTVEELERAPLEGRYELIDGELVELAPSGGDASNVGAVVAFFLIAHVRPRRLGKVFGANGGFVLFPDRQLVRVPDAAFVRADRLPPIEEQQGFLRLAPDLAVEAVSPFDRATEVEAKVAMYLEAGVRLVWVIHPRSRRVTVYQPDREARLLREGDELDGGEVLPGFRLAVAELFA